MPKLTGVPIEEAEAGMKLAASVTAASGQILLMAGLTLETTHIEFLKKRGIKTIQISDADFGSVDSEAYRKTIDKIAAAGATRGEFEVTHADPDAPDVTLTQMPADTPPPEAPTNQEIQTKEVEKAREVWKAERVVRKKEMEEKHGETFHKVEKALGEPKALGPDTSFQAARLFSDAAKDMTEQMFLDKKLGTDTLDLLTKNITLEIVSRQGMATLLNRAQAAGQYLLAHMVNVSVYSMYLAIQMELSWQEIQDVSIGGMLADIGMLALPEPFWVENRELWKKEKDQLVKHPDAGRRMILDTPGSREEWARIAYQHHERLDGSGYPQKLKAAQISLHSRIVQICDVYSAAVADRAYRDAHFPDDAMRHMMGNPHLFDRSIVEIFCQLAGFFPEGYIVQLSSGEQAAVLSTNSKNIFRPRVRLRKDKNGRPLMPHEQIVLDLAERPDVRIIKILEDDSARWV